MATLVEQLLKADEKKAGELKEGAFSSKKLAEVLGEKGKIDIKIKELPSRRINDISAYQYNAKGDLDYSKNFDAKLMSCVEGIVDPDLKDKDLQKHFGCNSAKSLCEKLFGYEVNYISDAIVALSDIPDNAEEEVKN